ncbi:MAG: ASKHA domain-containing protein [Pseudomonadota bacterium]|nr:ASKHA domain-containing protein [Pseudomonadota bacterium]
MPEPIHQVTFQPDNITVDVYRHGENLLRVAMAAGVHINASCGGNGTCGKCKVIIDKGKAESERSEKLSEEQWQQGYRLACRTKVIDDLVITIPPESRIDNSALKRKTGGQRHILKARDLNTLVQGLSINPAVFKCYLELPPPIADDNMSDLGRLMREIKKNYKYDRISTDFHLLRRLSRALRQADWKVTVTLVYNPKGFKLIDLEAGDTTKDNYSIIIDVGTTTVKGQLLNLEKCQIALSSTNSADSENLCAEDARYNSQVGFGEDVISRIVHSQKKGGLEVLQKAVVADINKIIAQLLESAGIRNDQISHLVLAGNTTMTQLLLGIDPKYIREDPYVPAANFFPPVRALEIGINLPDYIHIYIFPLVSSCVGGDIVAGVLGSGIFQRDELTLFIDVGTNGEIVLGNCDWLVCTSCSAGPAFEGGGVKNGMRASRGAIEQVRINPETYEPMVITIGNQKPLGICGSGLIDAAAELLLTGIIEPNGKFDRTLKTPRIREKDNGWEFVLVSAEQAAKGIGDIVLTEGDIDNLIRTKGAIYAGCRILLESVGLNFNDLDRVIIAGGFGQFINLERAITIGLLPEIEPEKFMFVGNGALLGARLVSFSREMMKDAKRVSAMMTNIELANNMKFMDEYVAALFLPHTDTGAFPGVMKMLEEDN